MQALRARSRIRTNPQVIVTFDPVDPAKKHYFVNLKLENKFTHDFNYKAQARVLSKNLRVMATVFPVVAGKISLIPVPSNVEEMAIFALELEP